MLRTKSVNLVVLGLAAMGCSTATSPSRRTGDAVVPTAEVDARERRAPAPVVDASTPMALEALRAVQAQAQAALAEPDEAEKIAACREFVAAHGDHPEAAAVIDELVDALDGKGNADKAELAALALKRVALEPQGHERAFELLRDVYLAHVLPAADVNAMLGVVRERLGQAAADAELESSDEMKQYRRLEVKQGELELATIEARIQLARGDAKKALESVTRARKLGDAMAKHVIAVGKDGKTIRTFLTGTFDDQHVVEAAVHRKLGDDAAARAALAKVVGFVVDLKLRELYQTTRDALGESAKTILTVRGEPEPAQLFSLKGIDGKTTKLAKYKGKVVLVAFWATWCGPCKKELPHLQKFAKDNAKKGVELLTINIDEFSQRSTIKPFLAANRLDTKVLFEDPEQLGGYDYSAIPALYVVDRDGKVAHARTGFDPDLDEKLAHEIKDVVEGKPSQGRELVTLELAPRGWQVLWQRPVAGDVQAIAVAPPLGKGGGEVGIVGRDGLVRFSADGRALPAQPVNGWAQSLRVADLDADGKREWVVGGWQDVKVLDDTGMPYWENTSDLLQLVVGVRDLDGDKFHEVIVRSENRVTVFKADSKQRWRSRPFTRIERVNIGPAGEVLVQADGDIVELDARGVETSRRPAPADREHSGRVELDGAIVDVFEAKFDAGPKLRHDLDADGKNDVVIDGGLGLIAYDAAGTPLLELRTNETDMSAALGDLDGKPGAEIALAIRHYGIVVLGHK
jgi:thiol-disulfide isomerase/thioredoxin